jgi:hypothetical protein
MANWKNKLDLTAIWKKVEEDEDYDEAGKQIAEKLKTLEPKFANSTTPLESIIDRFQSGFDNVNDFDSALSWLYDWGDINHNCWIITSW